MDNFDDIYYTMLGEYTPEHALPWVENAFAPGSDCDRALERIQSARQRLAQRLGTGEEDRDILDILNGYEFLQRELCRRMYRLSRDSGI